MVGFLPHAVCALLVLYMPLQCAGLPTCMCVCARAYHGAPVCVELRRARNMLCRCVRVLNCELARQVVSVLHARNCLACVCAHAAVVLVMLASSRVQL
jgi:hypothetical protein